MANVRNQEFPQVGLNFSWISNIYLKLYVLECDKAQ